MLFWNIFSTKNTSRKVGSSSKFSEPINYVLPSYQCTRSVLLCGAAYGDVSYRGAYLLDTQAAIEWVTKHSTSVWSQLHCVKSGCLHNAMKQSIF